MIKEFLDSRGRGKSPGITGITYELLTACCSDANAAAGLCEVVQDLYDGKLNGTECAAILRRVRGVAVQKENGKPRPLAMVETILNTVAASHDLDAFINCLKRDGTMCLVGAPAVPHPSPSVMGLILHRRAIAGSLIGGIAETQEMLDFCGEHGITATIERIKMQEINTAYERMLKSDVKYRFVIEMASLK